MTRFLTSAPARYTRTAIVLHWLLAFLILGNLLIGLTADLFPDGLVRPVIDFHKSIGLTVLGLVLLRILWRATHPPPPFHAEMSPLERLGAHAAHYALYALILLLPVSGWMHDSAFKDAAAHPLRIYWVIPWFRIGAIADLPPAQKEAFHSLLFAVHADAAWVLLGLLALHILGALKHQWVDKQPELQRMCLLARPSAQAQAAPNLHRINPELLPRSSWRRPKLGAGRAAAKIFGRHGGRPRSIGRRGSGAASPGPFTACLCRVRA